MKKIISLIIAFLSVFNLSAQADLVQNASARTVLSLDGQWDAIVDMYERGFSRRMTTMDSMGYFMDDKPRPYGSDPKSTRNTDLVEYDFETAPKLKVPSDWNSQDDKLFFYEGAVWYRKVFNYTPKANVRTYLYFGAANYESVVYLNGKRLGQHIGGFTPFQFDVTGQLKEGENRVNVYVNNRRKADGVPTLKFDWWNYGGLTRSVSVIETPQTFIQDYFVQLEKGKNNVIGGWIKLKNAAKNTPLSIDIPELNIKEKLVSNDTGFAFISIKTKNLSLWSPENPKLYTVKISTADDKIEDEIGFRTIETRGLDILLNGKPIFLKGISIHEEAPYRSGRCNNVDDAKILLGWAKEMGCNYVRLAHYPHNEAMVREAEKMGLMVWSEVPTYWFLQFENPSVYQNALNQITENITRDKNRAAVIIWSIANETPETETRFTFLKNLATAVRSMDNTRLVSAALLAKSKNNVFAIDDPLGEVLDVMSCNEYIGWYNNAAEDCGLMTWTSKHQKPLIMSEFGGEAVAGLHGKPTEIWTEEYMDRIYKNQVAMLDKIPFLRGASPWILMDFRSPLRLRPTKQDYYNRKGVVSDKGIKKLAFYTMQKWYQGK